MNIIAQQNALKDFSDQVLQKELLQPTGSMPSYLVLSELTRRKGMRDRYASQQKQPGSSMADEFAKGMGSADVGNYSPAVRGAMPGPAPGGPPDAAPQAPPSPMGGEPAQGPPQGYADGGQVMDTPDPNNPNKKRNQGGVADASSDGEGGTYARGGPVRFDDGGSVLRKLQQQYMNQHNIPKSWMAPVDPSQGFMTVGDPNDYPPAPSAYTYPMTRGQASAADAESRRGLENPNQPLPYARGDAANRQPSFAGLPSAMPPPPVNRLDFLPPYAGLRNEPSQEGGAPEPTGAGAPAGFVPPGASIPPWLRGGLDVQGMDTPSAGAATGVDPTALRDTGAPDPGAPSAAGLGGAAAGVRGGTGMNIGGQGLEDYINQIRGLQAPDRFGEMDKRNSADREKLRQGAETDKGMALLAAAGATLQGRSPFGLQNIGAGVQAGVKEWSEASKEMRRAENDIRRAEDTITIARANRDEKLEEKGISLYAQGQTRQMQAEEMRQRALDRQATASSAHEDRKATLALGEKKFQSEAEDRKMHREQTEITGYAGLAEKYERDATAAARAYSAQAAVLGDPTKTAMMSEQEKAQAASELEKTKTQRDFLGYQANQYRGMHEKTLNIATARRSGIPTAGEDRGYTSDGKKLKNGQRFITKDGQFGIWKEE